MARRAGEAGLEAIADIAMRRLYPPAMAAEHLDAFAERRARFIETDPAVLGQACSILAALDIRDEVRRMDIPLLAAVGEWDEATPPAMAEELASLVTRATFSLIEGCAHVPTIRAPDRFCDLVEQFASNNPDTAMI